jgi:carbonic anhydrase
LPDAAPDDTLEAKIREGANPMGTRLDDILRHNERFVQNGEYEQFRTGRYPDKKLAILTCMDTRLIDLLPRAMNLKNGDAKIIRNAGAIVYQPFGNVMRSLMVAVYELGAEEIFVVGHHDCGMTGLDAGRIFRRMKERGVAPGMFDTLRNAGIDLNRWLTGFDSVREGVERSVSLIRNHPLLPPGLPVHGLIIDPVTGKLEVVTEGYGKAG